MQNDILLYIIIYTFIDLKIYVNSKNHVVERLT